MQWGLLVEFFYNPYYEIVHWRALLKSVYYEYCSGKWLLQQSAHHKLVYLIYYKLWSVYTLQLTYPKVYILFKRPTYYSIITYN